jgi:DEAD/DEAH box helicase domain-containing protein
MAGYSGSIASTWQRAGRAGRRNAAAASILVANSSPLDQFIIQHPEYFFGQSPEHGLINPDNLEILLNHVKCAVFELPFLEGEKFGGVETGEILTFLQENGFVHRARDRWHWASEAYPADAVSLRAVSSDNFVVLDVTGEPRIISTVDFPSALTTLHEKAIYIHEGRQYFVEKLDYKERRAHVKQVDLDYFTDAISYTQVRIIDTFETQEVRNASKRHGEIHLTTQVVGFKKIKFYTLENVGAGDLELPEQEMHTTSYWLTLPRSLMDSLPYLPSLRLGGVRGLAQAMRQIAVLFLMCDPRDLQVALEDNVMENASEFVPATSPSQIFEPNIFLYDNYPSGIGLSQPLYDLHDRVLKETARLIRSCPCDTGCPSCVGPQAESGDLSKQVALDILSLIV